jgi:uncharacterized cofD-like protein
MSTNNSASFPARPVAPNFQSEQTGDAPVQYRPLKVVAMGGGTGLSTLLRGLKHYFHPQEDYLLDFSDLSEPVISDLTAVVTVTDDGGSSGRLRKDFNMLPPGDIRNCLVALSEDEALLSKLFQYRFTGGSGLEGHNFGNLFLAALTALTHDFSQAVRLCSAILAIRGRILPATTTDVQLCAEMDDGTHVFGETSISASQRRIMHLQMVPPDVKPLPETLHAIAEADLITVGPGSLFTSLVPNLLVHGIAEAIAASPAVKVYICNLMTQANESLGLTAAQHIKALYQHAGTPLFDYAMVNNGPIEEELMVKYALERASAVVSDDEALEALGVRVVKGNYVAEGAPARHDADKLAHDILQLTYKYQLFTKAQLSLAFKGN